ncbi:MAG: adenylyltransferase/cytidyltransferase family protein [Nitrospirae bacterium]|nr:adenylyltransferase/cytidyltransferase family protein [Magnetococcales bacterium]HAT50174.1 cytidyltransferase [Alphaproteobacteria bacterium]
MVGSHPDKKIVSLQELGQQAQRYREEGFHVVLCHGTFDLLHPGHIRHLTKAKEFGDRLLVTVTADRFVKKGPGRPVFPGTLRAESLAALAVVDGVAIVEDVTAIPAIQTIRPKVYAKGSDYVDAKDDISGNIRREQAEVHGVGGEVRFTDGITFSSSRLINQYLDVFTPETQAYLNDFKSIYNEKKLIESVQSLSSKKVLVFGEAIIDEYCLTTPLGLTGKSNTSLACRYIETEQYAGGSLAVANHLAGFVNQVGLITGVGRDERQNSFMKNALAENIAEHFFHFETAPTLLKRRFVDADITKLFEVYYQDPNPTSPQLEADICQWIADHAGSYDAVVVADYGNGLISPAMVEAISKHARFMAVNTQVNSGNHCHHVIHRYPRADFISLNECEVRLATHNRHAPMERLARDIGHRLSARWIAITRGMKGAVMLDIASGKTYDAPPLSTRVVDRVGAGDAFLSLAGLCLAGDLPPDVALFIGSVAAAIDVQIVCNRESIHPVTLFKYVSTLMK